VLALLGRDQDCLSTERARLLFTQDGVNAGLWLKAFKILDPRRCAARVPRNARKRENISFLHILEPNQRISTIGSDLLS
jgi:hypothetical protein